MSLKRKEALKDLKTDDSIVIKLADKGGGVVILDKSEYNEVMIDFLNDPTTYQILPTDMTIPYKNELDNLLSEAKIYGIINEKEYDFVNIIYPRILVIHYLPKIYKDKKKKPGRPIVSGMNSITSRLSAYFDFYLQKYILKMRSYLWDSQSLITLLKNIKVDDELFLCTCIPHESGIKAVEECLESDIHIKNLYN